MPRRDIGDEYDIDYAKLEKLEKMITRVDADINRMSADKDKLAVVETLKKVWKRGDSQFLKLLIYQLNSL